MRGTLQLAKSGQTRLVEEAIEWQESIVSCRKCQHEPHQTAAWHVDCKTMQTAHSTAYSFECHSDARHEDMGESILHGQHN